MLKHYKTHAFLGASVVWLLPLVLSASNEPPAMSSVPLTATDLLNNISTYILNPLIFLLFSAAFVVFIWGLVQFLANLDNEEARQTAGKHALWGIVGMVVMVGVNQIVDLILNTVSNLGS